MCASREPTYRCGLASEPCAENSSAMRKRITYAASTTNGLSRQRPCRQTCHAPNAAISATGIGVPLAVTYAIWAHRQKRSGVNLKSTEKLPAGVSPRCNAIHAIGVHPNSAAASAKRRRDMPRSRTYSSATIGQAIQLS